jgi:hypothetical protein
MKDLKITWDPPASLSGIDELHVYRKSGDHSSENDLDLFRSGATKVAAVAGGAVEYVDAQVSIGSYTYGVFSYNSSGYGPGDLANEVFEVTPNVPQTGPAELTSEVQAGLVITSTTGFQDYTSLVFDHTLTLRDGTAVDVNLAGVQYEFKIATDNQMANVVDTITKTTLVNGEVSGLSYISREPFSDLTPDTTYYSQLIVTGAIEGQSSIVESLTNPCTIFGATRTSDGDGTHTVSITTTPEAKITLTEELVSPKLRGHMRPVLNDENGDLFIGIAEGSFRGDGATGGKLVFDAAWPKFFSYIPEEIPYNNFANGLWWAQASSATNHAWGGTALWTTTERDFLQNGGDIYDGTLSGAAPYVLNVYNFVKRVTSPTNKILYINDYNVGTVNGNTYDYYGPHKFVSFFKDVAEYGGFTLEQLDDSIDPVNFIQNHGDALQNKFSTAGEWLTYLLGYDLVVYIGVEGPTGSLPQAFIDGMLDYYDAGGGLFATTDHDFAQGSINQLVYNYGVQFTGNVDRNSANVTYKVSNILSNTDYIQYGSHPLFNNLDPDSYIFAGASEGLIEYNTGQFPTAPQVSRTSEFTADSNGSLVVGAHTSGDAIENRKLVISTSNGCGTALDAI